MEQNTIESFEKDSSRFLPKWFIVWFLLSCLIMLVGGVADHLSRKEEEGIKGWGASVSIFVMFVLVMIIWKKRISLSNFISKVSLPLLISATFLGWFFAEIDELVCYPFNPLVPDISLAGDLILTTPMYICAHLFWNIILKKYKFSRIEAILTGGISLALFEIFMGNGFSVLLLILWPFMIMIHGVHIIIPKILVFNDNFKGEQIESKWKYFFGILFPALGIGIGIIISSILANLFGLTFL